jgi:hypothetical protein
LEEEGESSGPEDNIKFHGTESITVQEEDNSEELERKARL